MMTPHNDRSCRDTLEPVEVEQLPRGQVVTPPPRDRGGIGLSGRLEEIPIARRESWREGEDPIESLAATRLDGDFRRDCESSDYAQLGHAYDTIAPAYQFGDPLATVGDFKGHEWEVVESEARHAWEERDPGPWEQLKAAARHAWDKVTGSVL